MHEYTVTRPEEIEARSMEIIRRELTEMGITLEPQEAPVVCRAIHATADFDFARNLYFTPGAVERGVAALKGGCALVTDTNMALSGLNRQAREALGVEGVCLMADPQVARRAREEGTTRAWAAVEEAAGRWPGAVYAVGNAPTALVRMAQLIREGRLRPALVVAVPVGFVNVVESKEEILELCRGEDIPAIVARGRKGGSTVAAAVGNALLYQASGRKLSHIM